MAKSKFTANLLNYAKLHPEDELSAYFLESLKESNRVHRQEAEHWKKIAFALEHYQYRVTKASIKSDEVNNR